MVDQLRCSFIAERPTIQYFTRANSVDGFPGESEKFVPAKTHGANA